MLAETGRLIGTGRVFHRRHTFRNFKIIYFFFFLKSSFSSVLNQFSLDKCSNLLESKAVLTGEI